MIKKLDYRCRGEGCSEKVGCRRHLAGTAAKNCAVPFAALDKRDRGVTGACHHFQSRILAPIIAESEGGCHD